MTISTETNKDGGFWIEDFHVYPADDDNRTRCVKACVRPEELPDEDDVAISMEDGVQHMLRGAAIEEGLTVGPNVRKQSTNNKLSERIGRALKNQSPIDRPNATELKSHGLKLVVQDFKITDVQKAVDGRTRARLVPDWGEAGGVLDGGGTAQRCWIERHEIIEWNKAHPESKIRNRIDIKIVVTSDPELWAQMAEALNTTKPVSAMSLQNAAGMLDWLKEANNQFAHGKRISYLDIGKQKKKKNEDPTDFRFMPCLEQLRMLKALNVDQYPSNDLEKQPTVAYAGKNQIVKEHGVSPEVYQKGLKLIRPALCLYETMMIEGAQILKDLLKKKNKKLYRAMTVHSKVPREFLTYKGPLKGPIPEHPNRHVVWLNRAVVYPMLSALRVFIRTDDEDTFVFDRKTGELKEFWRQAAPDLLRNTIRALLEGHHVSATSYGKAGSSWEEQQAHMQDLAAADADDLIEQAKKSSEMDESLRDRLIGKGLDRSVAKSERFYGKQVRTVKRAATESAASEKPKVQPAGRTVRGAGKKNTPNEK